MWASIPGPSDLSEASAPAAKGEKTQPEEDAAFDPVCQAIEEDFTLLANQSAQQSIVCRKDLGTHKESTVSDNTC